MRLSKTTLGICAAAALLLLFAVWWGRSYWPPDRDRAGDEAAHADAAPAEEGSAPVRITPQARKNLRLVSRPLALSTYWRSIDLPGMVVDRPGVSDRGVVAPVSGVVMQIHVFPGDMVAPHTPLFTLRLLSESFHAAQLELFKATREMEIARRQRERLANLAQSGTIAQSRIIEIDNELDRLQATADAYRQDLQSRGLSAERIEAVAGGRFMTEMIVRAPGEQGTPPPEIMLTGNASDPLNAQNANPPGDEPPPQFRFELQSLNVELGQQVDAGQVLCHLADHRALLVEGRGFQDDMPAVHTAARRGWPASVDFETADRGDWPPLPAALPIDHVANVVDAATRTFAFYLPLENQWQTYRQGDAQRVLWRFRPGSRVRLRIPVERFENVFVVPREAIVRDGAETYIFRQNGDFFDRRPVHVLYEDRRNAVLANDGSVRPGVFVAQNAASALNRAMKAQSASGVPAGFHVHADGTVHGAH